MLLKTEPVRGVDLYKTPAPLISKQSVYVINGFVGIHTVMTSEPPSIDRESNLPKVLNRRKVTLHFSPGKDKCLVASAEKR
jgi:hypothetical protein